MNNPPPKPQRPKRIPLDLAMELLKEKQDQEQRDQEQREQEQPQRRLIFE